MAEHWYYAHNNEQKGPVSGPDLLALEKAGLLRPGTLVWRSGLSGWQPWSAVAADVNTAAQAEGAAIDEVAVCAYSGQVLPVSRMVKYGDRWVAVEHKDAFVHALREGAAVQAMTGSGETQPVGFWWRVLAAIIDWAVLIVPSLLMQVPYMILLFKQTLASGGRPPANPMSPFENMTPGMLIAWVLATLGQFALSLWYETWMTGKYAGTVGKLALGFRVTRTDGDPVSYSRAFGRWGGKMLNYLIWYGLMYALLALGFIAIWPSIATGKPPTGGTIPATSVVLIILGIVWGFVGGCGFYMAGWTKRKQGLHDLIAKTVVVRKDPR